MSDNESFRIRRRGRCVWVDLVLATVFAASLTGHMVHAQPANDDCTTPATLEIGITTSGTLDGATPDYAPLCEPVFSYSYAPGVWYRVVGDGSTLTVRLDCGSEAQFLRVFCASACDERVCVASPDNYCLAKTSTTASWCSELGVEYFILVFSYLVPSDFELTVSSEGMGCSDPQSCVTASNDNCATAATVGVGSTTPVTLAEALDDRVPPCESDYYLSYPSGLWYRVIGDGTTLTARVSCGPEYPFRQLRVFCGGCDNTFCKGSSECVFGLTAASVSWCSQAGEEYLILVFGDFQWSDFELTVESDGAACPNPPGCAAQPNDDCVNARPISIGASVSANAENAFRDYGDCYHTDSYPGVWFEVIGDGTTLSARLECSELASHLISVQCGDCDALNCVYDGVSCGSPYLPTWCSRLGVPYRILVAERISTGDDFTLTINSDSTPCHAADVCYHPATNDSCAAARPITIGSTIGGSTHGAEKTVVEDCGPAPGLTADVWYKVTGDGTAFRASLCGPDGVPTDHRLHVYCNRCDFQTCVDGGYAGSSCAEGDEVRWCTVPGKEYLLRVTGPPYEGSGNFDLTVVSEGVACAPATGCLQTNDLCQNPTALTPGGIVREVTEGMTNDAATFCGAYDRGLGMWYEVIGDGTVMEVVFCNIATSNLAVSVHCGACDELACVEQTGVAEFRQPPDCAVGSPKVWRWCSREGERYLLHVFDWQTANLHGGEFSLKVQSSGIRCAEAGDCIYDPPPPNNRCADADPISGEGNFAFENTYATPEEPFDMCHFTGLDVPTHDVWYCWTSPCDGPVTVETCGETTVDTQLAVFDDCNCDNRETVCNDDSCGVQSRVTFQAVVGRTYGIQLGTHIGLGGGSGEFRIICGPGLEAARPCTMGDRTSERGRNQTDAFNSTRGQWVVVDEFAVDSTTNLDTICWWGGDFDGENPCNRDSVDQFQITYYTDDCGKPGPILGGPFRQSDGSLTVTGPARTSQSILSTVPENEYSAIHAAVPFTAEESVWVEISNSSSGECAWYWEAQAWRGGRLYQSPDDSGTDVVHERENATPNNVGLLVGAFNYPDTILGRAYVVPACYPPPDNDACSAPASIGLDQTASINTTGATTDGAEVVPYGGSHPLWEYVNYYPLGDRQVHKDVWFLHEAGCSATFEVDLCDADFNTKAAIYALGTACEYNAQPFAISDDECGPELGTKTVLSANAREGDTYLLRVGGYRGEFGMAAMSINYAPSSRASLREFAQFARCFGGDESTNPCCSLQDFDNDGDVDPADFSLLQGILLGP